MTNKSSDDEIINSSMTEIFIFFVFFLFILIGASRMNSPKDDPPPTMRLAAAENYHFQSNKAEVPSLEDPLRLAVIAQILDAYKNHDIDHIMFIGHTDCKEHQTMLSGNVDETLSGALAAANTGKPGQPIIQDMKVADNAGLGMKRAIAFLNMVKSAPELKGQDYQFRVTSAAHLYPAESVKEKEYRDLCSKKYKVEVYRRFDEEFKPNRRVEVRAIGK